MKVICIDASRGKILPNVLPNFKEGDVVEASQSFFYLEAYCIKEHQFIELNGRSVPVSWIKERFIPLSDIDEMELVKEREIVNA